MLGGYVVEVPGVVVYVADPCLHFPGVRFHGDESAVHQLDHVTDGVHCAQFLDNRSVIRKDPDGAREIHVVLYGVDIVRIFPL